MDWKVGRQSKVTRSTTEAELLSASDAGVELIWWQRLFDSLGLNIDHTPFLNIDNLQTVGIINKDVEVLSTRLRHVDIHQHWLRQEAQDGRISVKWVPTAEMKADGFTKPLPEQRHNEFLRHLNMVNIQSMIDDQE